MPPSHLVRVAAVSPVEVRVRVRGGAAGGGGDAVVAAAPGRKTLIGNLLYRFSCFQQDLVFAQEVSIQKPDETFHKLIFLAQAQLVKKVKNVISKWGKV